MEFTKKKQKEDVCKFSDWDKFDSNWSDEISRKIERNKIKILEPESEKNWKKYNKYRDHSKPLFDLEKIANTKEYKKLTTCQKKALLKALDMIEKGENMYTSDENMLLFLHGPPGVGKTTVAKFISKLAKGIGMGTRNTALTGAAAVHIDGVTIDWLLNQNYKDIKNEGAKIKMSHNRRGTIQQRFGNARILLIDEISFCSPKKLARIDKLLRMALDDKPFGGLHVIILGDMFQLRPVRALSLFKAAVNIGVLKNATMGDYTGTGLFQGFTKVELITQKRAKGWWDKQVFAKMRNIKNPFTKEFMTSLPKLKRRDIRQFKWRYAPFIVPNNAERILLNEMKIRLWAKEHNEPIFVYYDRVIPKKDGSEKWDADTLARHLSPAHPILKRYFVRNAPCYITNNIDPQIKLANKSKARLHSMTWKNGYELPTEWTPGEEIEVPFPESVNVVMEKDFKHAKAPEVVPLREVEDDESLEIKQPDGDTKPRVIKTHDYQLGFAMTYHCVQGATSKYLVLVVNKGSRVEFEHLYVGITRVENIAKYLRIVECESYDHLKSKSPPSELTFWLNNYDSNGKWIFKGLSALVEQNKKKWTSKIKTVDTLKLMYLEDLRNVVKELNVVKHNLKTDECIEIIQSMLQLPTGPPNLKFDYGKGLKRKSRKRNRSDANKGKKSTKKRNTSKKSNKKNTSTSKKFKTSKKRKITLPNPPPKKKSKASTISAPKTNQGKHPSGQHAPSHHPPGHHSPSHHSSTNNSKQPSNNNHKGFVRELNFCFVISTVQTILTLEELHPLIQNQIHQQNCQTPHCLACAFEKVAREKLISPNILQSVKSIAHAFRRLATVNYNYGQQHCAGELTHQILDKLYETSAYKNILDSCKTEVAHYIICNSCNQPGKIEILKPLVAWMKCGNLFEPQTEPCENYACRTCNHKLGFFNYDEYNANDPVKKHIQRVLTSATKGEKILTLGKISFIAYKRNCGSHQFRWKDPTPITLNIPNYLPLGWIEHYGSYVNHGHYISNCKKGSIWYKCDDENISPSMITSVSDNKNCVFVVLKKGVNHRPHQPSPSSPSNGFSSEIKNLKQIAVSVHCKIRTKFSDLQKYAGRGVKPFMILETLMGNVILSSGSVVDFTGSAIVNAANEECLGGGGVDGVISKRGGPALYNARKQLQLISRKPDIRCPVGEARITIGGNLDAKYCIHAVGPKFQNPKNVTRDLFLLKSAYVCAVSLANDEDKIETIAFSLLSAGIYKGNQSLESVLAIGLSAILQSNFGKDIYMVAFTKDEIDCLKTLGLYLI